MSPNPFEHVATGDIDPAILEAEAALRDAQLTADCDALERLLEDDLLFAGPDGGLASKMDDLAAHRSGAVRFLAHQPVDLVVKRVGVDIALTSLAARLQVSVEGEGSVEGTYRYTRLWRRTGGQWRVAGGHVARILES